jgi:hypothetical protein
MLPMRRGTITASTSGLQSALAENHTISRRIFEPPACLWRDVEIAVNLTACFSQSVRVHLAHESKPIIPQRSVLRTATVGVLTDEMTEFRRPDH